MTQAYCSSIAEALDARTGSGVDVQYIDFRTLMDVVASVLADGKLSQADFEPVAEYVERLFDEHVQPYDIPNIGPLAETFVDKMLRRLIRPALQLLFDRFAVNADSGNGDSHPGGGGPIVSI
tara:strand:- start:729 stop:1094 length:366 start_codon:yes stop_codon:yes gene_type:complete